jgi:hypothetical protein
VTATNPDTIRDAKDAMSRAVNIMGRGEAELAAALLADHRTLIQREAVVFLSFFRQLAHDAERGFVDERNAAAGKLAIVLRDAADAAGFGDDLPFI